ncbi:hypothetical protein ABID59_005664 [Bradyrhizobium sp. S3.3.6]
MGSWWDLVTNLHCALRSKERSQYRALLGKAAFSGRVLLTAQAGSRFANIVPTQRFFSLLPIYRKLLNLFGERAGGQRHPWHGNAPKLFAYLRKLLILRQKGRPSERTRSRRDCRKRKPMRSDKRFWLVESSRRPGSTMQQIRFILETDGRADQVLTDARHQMGVRTIVLHVALQQPILRSPCLLTERPTVDVRFLFSQTRRCTIHSDPWNASDGQVAGTSRRRRPLSNSNTIAQGDEAKHGAA